MAAFSTTAPPTGPHAAAPVFTVGAPSLPYALVLLHGRGGTARNILAWAEPAMEQCFVVAPEAVGNEWYPHRFIVPQQENEPHLSSALSVVGATIASLMAAGYTPERIILAGFSQGACLAAEYVKRFPAPYAGVILMSGGLIGTTEEVTAGWHDALASTPVYLASDVADSHIPLERVEVTRDLFTAAGYQVTTELLKDFGHAPHPTAVRFLTSLVTA